MTLLVSEGGAQRVIGTDEKHVLLDRLLDSWEAAPARVLLLPPDHTRLYSDAGPITAYLYARLTALGAAVDIMPALGTHAAMTEAQLRMMFGDTIPLEAFKVHDWRNDVVEAGVVPGAFLREVSGGRVDYDMRVTVNRALLTGGYDRIVSVGQVVPHEVVGMANYTKNLCVGVGGEDMINKTHFLGAVCNMETILGRADTPVRRVFDKAFGEFLSHLPVDFVLTVIGKENDEHVLRGLYVGDDDACFLAAAALSRAVNLTLLDAPVRKAAVYLTPKEFASTWLGDKAVYRLRMAIADGGELLILAPAVREFGEDREIDRLIRKYGYRGSETILKAVQENADLRDNLSAAAHLIHGSSEERFSITYCTRPENLSREEVEGVGYGWADYETIAARYDPATLRDGPQTVDGEEIFYVGNPALGLWALREQFEE